MRRVLDEKGFIEIETPFLTKSTPEGARDFLVPSRLQLGDFYALPQSPQLFKQILMVSGLDKYYQIVRCFRDEDLRADRQPEFTQLDVEMSFATEADVMAVTNEVFGEICRICDRSFPDAPTVITYAEAMDRYGIDRPDMRFEILLSDVSDIVASSDFKVFSGAIAGGGVVKGLCAPGGGRFTRKEIDEYAAYAGDYGAKGLAWCKVAEGGFAGGTAKFLDESAQAALRERFGADDGDILMFVADELPAANKALAALRSKLGRDLRLYGPDDFAWCWVTEFPLLEWNADDNRWDSPHHPFTSPRSEDLDKMASDQRHRAGRRVNPYPRPQGPAEGLPPAGHQRRGGPVAVRILPPGPRVRRPTPRRDRLRARPGGHAHGRRRQPPRGDRLPQDPARPMPADRRPLPRGRAAAPRAGHPPRGRGEGREEARRRVDLLGRCGPGRKKGAYPGEQTSARGVYPCGRRGAAAQGRMRKGEGNDHEG
jgi:hypothetical protein